MTNETVGQRLVREFNETAIGFLNLSASKELACRIDKELENERIIADKAVDNIIDKYEDVICPGIEAKWRNVASILAKELEQMLALLENNKVNETWKLRCKDWAKEALDIWEGACNE